MSNHTPSLDQLKRAIAITEQIDALQSQLAAVLGGSSSAAVPAAAPAKTRKGKRTVSPEARAKMAVAQRARWALRKGGAAPAAKPEKKKRGITPEGRAKLAAAMKARWDARKKGAPAPTAKAQKPAKAPKAPKAKRVVSPEARAKMVAAAKKRWANAKK